MADILSRIRARRDSAAQWAANNPTLATGELGVETDAGQIRAGDGVTPFSALRVFLSVPAAAIAAAQALLNATSVLAQRAALGITADISDINDVSNISGDGWSLITAPTFADMRTLLGTGSDDVAQVSYFHAAVAPTGWLKCNGAQVSRTVYAALFARIGTSYGVGDGATTFTLPDFRGEFLRGWDDGRGIDAARALGTAQAQQLESHSHRTSHTQAANDFGLSTTSNVARYANTTAGVFQHGLTSVPYTGSVGAETRPRNVALLACIKY